MFNVFYKYIVPGYNVHVIHVHLYMLYEFAGGNEAYNVL